MIKVAARLRLAASPVLLALLAYWLMAVSVSPRIGVTADEVVHLTGGYSYWKFNDYRMHPENGTLPMRVAALPWLVMDVHFPPLDHPEWVASKVNRLGDVFFFQSGNDVDRLLLAARAMIALFGVFTVWLTWRWSRGLFGRRAGWVSLALAVFCPALLAHGGLATSDMGLTACLLAAISCYWLLLHRVTWPRLLATALACGLTFLAKMSGVLVVPLVGALLLLRWLRPAPLVLALGPVRWLRRRTPVMAATLALTLAVGAGSLVVLWAGYGFRYDGFNRTVSQTTGYYFDWDVLLEKKQLPWSDESSLVRLAPQLRAPEPTLMTATIGWIRDHRLLPEAYLWGFAHTYKFSRERPAFFLGDYRKTGWPLFFPVAFLLKTPLPALLLIAAGALAVFVRRRRPEPGMRPVVARVPRALFYRAAPLVIFLVVYWTMAVRMHLNIGHRHILPTYPVFYVFAGAAVWWLTGTARRWGAVLLVVALAAHAVDSLAVRPFYLSYFQPLAGGVPRGFHHFVDSSYDWGQGLPALTDWLAAKKQRGDAAPVYLTYFGADSPRGRHLDVIRFGDELNDAGARNFPAQVRGGWFVMSATYFQGVYLPMRGTWGAREESLYQEILARLQQAPADTATLSGAARQRLLQDAMDVEVLQFSRLCHHLRAREPREVIGGSLLVYSLSDAEVAAALYGPLGGERHTPAP